MGIKNIINIIKDVKAVQKQPAIQNISDAAKNANSLNLKALVEAALEKIGHANIIVAGKTGVGKSTLVNAVFQGNLAL